MPLARRLRALDLAACAAVGALILAGPALGQWEHRYPKLADFGHHVYLEQHELPVFAGGPSDPAPSPDGESLAFAKQGWLWRLDLETGRAERLTSGAYLDSRPRWSPDGTQLAFVRDYGTDTAVVVLDLSTGQETLIDSPAIDLDPEFTADGASIYYSSGASGSLNLYRRHVETGVETMITDRARVERNARRLPGGTGIVYQHGAGPSRTLRARGFLSGEDAAVHHGGLSYHLVADTHPTQRLIVFAAPIDNAYHVWTVDLDAPEVVHRITNGDRYAMTPAFSADGDHVYFVEADAERRFQIKRLPTHGGPIETVPIAHYEYGTRLGALTISAADATGAPVTARVVVRDADGRPVANPHGATQVDSQTGRHYFYVEGEAELSVPAGRYTVEVARGPMAPVQRETVRVRDGGQARAAVRLAPLWDARAAGYAAADHHVHLNGDGHHRADHGDAARQAAGEDLDLLAPMSWNRWERRIDADRVGVTTRHDGVIIAQTQEVRSHFHGHVGLINQSEAFAPWFWGPSNPVLGDPDLTNGLVFDFARAENAFVTYVHPLVDDADPFEAGLEGAIPLELAADGVLEARMGLELVCAWTSPLGNAALWYRFLNIGRPVAAMSGTDAWVDFHRTPAMGTARTYVRLDGAEPSVHAINAAAIAGRSFVTTGPALQFELGEGVRPGDVIAPRAEPVPWRATLSATMAVDVVELIVNGAVVARFDGVEAGESRTLSGEVTLPDGGWAALRAYASERQDDAWPSMHLRPFAHTSPVWIGAVGSTEPGARAAAARDLIGAIENARTRADIAYGPRDMSRMHARFDAALEQLRAFAATP